VGLTVDLAFDGEECVRKVFKSSPGFYDIVICDLHMPIKDGYQACAEIREWERENTVPRAPIIALSANVMSDVAERCKTAGFSQYISKPVNFGDLKNTILDLLANTDN